jgi:hypothetical protein
VLGSRAHSDSAPLHAVREQYGQGGSLMIRDEPIPGGVRMSLHASVEKDPPEVLS